MSQRVSWFRVTWATPAWRSVRMLWRPAWAKMGGGIYCPPGGNPEAAFRSHRRWALRAFVAALALTDERYGEIL